MELINIKSKRDFMTVKIMGHRGMGPTSQLKKIPDALFPENTLASFDHAIKNGADGIELDVSVTKDGQVVAIHDDELNRHIAGADRAGNDWGMVYDYNLSELENFDVGHGQRIPALRDVLDLICTYNPQYRMRNGDNLKINIELKGADCVEKTYATVMEYVNAGLLDKEDFIFNTFQWDRLAALRAIDPEILLVPNVRSATLFGEHNVEMPGFKVKNGAKHDPAGLQKLQELHDRIGCHAFDCVIYDVRDELLDLCAQNGIGLYASPSSYRANSSKVEKHLELLIDRASDLPAIYFKADDVTEIVSEWVG